MSQARRGHSERAMRSASSGFGPVEGGAPPLSHAMEVNYDYSQHAFTPACTECGALVPVDRLDKHTSWHNTVEADFKDHERAIRRSVPWWHKPAGTGPL